MKMIATMGDQRVRRLRLSDRRRDAARLQRRRPARLRRAGRRRRSRSCRRSRPTPRGCWPRPRCSKRIEEFGMEVVASRPEQFDAFIAARDAALGAASSRKPRSSRNDPEEACHEPATETPAPGVRRRGERHRPDRSRSSLADVKAINAAMNEYAVLVWRGQPLTAAAADRLRDVTSGRSTSA